MRLRNIPGSKDVIADSRFVVQNPDSQRGKWAEVFRNNHPVWIEVGMGKGRFIMDMARLHPDINFIGIEMYDSVLLRAVQKREQMEEELSNLYFIRMDARNLPEVFAQGEPIPIKMEKTGDDAFEINYKLDVPVREDIYEYIVSEA